MHLILYCIQYACVIVIINIVVVAVGDINSELSDTTARHGVWLMVPNTRLPLGWLMNQECTTGMWTMCVRPSSQP